jgi:hypothetical protein
LPKSTASRAPASQATSSRIAGRHHLGISGRLRRNLQPKASAEPALEVDDFVVHTIGRQARQNLKARGVFLPDFKAVFHDVQPNLVSFMEVASVTKDD